MKQVICCLLFLLLAGYFTTAQKNIFFKPARAKDHFIAKKPVTGNDHPQQSPLRPSLYNVSATVNRPFRLTMPREYISGSSNEDLLFILGLAGSIAGSIYADKMHYSYNYDSQFYHPANYWNWRDVH